MYVVYLCIVYLQNITKITEYAVYFFDMSWKIYAYKYPFKNKAFTVLVICTYVQSIIPNKHCKNIPLKIRNKYVN